MHATQEKNYADIAIKIWKMFQYVEKHPYIYKDLNISPFEFDRAKEKAARFQWLNQLSHEVYSSKIAEINIELGYLYEELKQAALTAVQKEQAAASSLVVVVPGEVTWAELRSVCTGNSGGQSYYKYKGGEYPHVSVEWEGVDKELKGKKKIKKIHVTFTEGGLDTGGTRCKVARRLSTRQRGARLTFPKLIGRRPTKPSHS